MGRSYHKVQNTHIIAQTQNERWGMDLIDMTRYPNMYNMRYIVNVVDYFSKYIMVRAIRHKTAALVSAAFQSICLQVNTYPHILQTDNGGEFKGELDLFIEAHNITAPHQRINHVFTQTYSPTTNGLVEKLNQELRRKI